MVIVVVAAYIFIPMQSDDAGGGTIYRRNVKASLRYLDWTRPTWHSRQINLFYYFGIIMYQPT